jgi:hypothetical protein
MSTPRGIRNNNPLNIKTGDKWLGMIGEDEGFLQFSEASYGIRAAARVLQTYQTVHHLHTIREIIHRWAPPADNNPSDEYARAVAIWAGLEPDDEVDVYDFDTALAMLRAMVRFENGKPPEGEYWYADSVYERGLREAGVLRIKKLPDSRVVKGTATAAAGIVAAQGVLADLFGLPAEVTAMLPTALQNMSEQTVAAVVLLISLAGAAYSFYARRDDKLNGRL